MMETTKVYFGSWEQAFAVIGADDAFDLTTHHVEGKNHWLLTEAKARKLLRRGSTLKGLENAYFDYAFEREEG